jgi:hypothetical protein
MITNILLPFALSLLLAQVAFWLQPPIQEADWLQPPIFFVFSIILYSALGAAFGYRWPGTGWKWGVWLAGVPSLIVLLRGIYIIEVLGVPMRFPIESLFGFMLTIIFSCAAASVAAQQALKKKSF